MSNAAAITGQRDFDGWAEVRAHDAVVRYHRSGAGPVVILLQPPSVEPLWPELLELLGDGNRLIVPDPPANPHGDHAELWLRALLDGLGVSNVTVVATEGFCLAALERALLAPEQVARMIMVCSGRGSESAIDGTLATPAQAADVPFLVLRRDRPVSEIVPVVASFLRR